MIRARSVDPAIGASDFARANIARFGAQATGSEYDDIKKVSHTRLRPDSRRILFVGHEWKVGESHYLRVPRRLITEFGKSDVLETRIARASDPEKEFRIYTSTSFVDPHLNISRLNPARGEIFLVFSLRNYGFADFARDFNKHKPKDFGNVILTCSNNKVKMSVDSNVLEIKQARITADGGRIFFEGLMVDKPTGRIRITKQFERFDLHLVDASTSQPRVLAMKGGASGIEIWHTNSRNQPDHRTRWIPAVPLSEGKREWERLEGNRLLALDSSRMTRKEVRAWIDTEGCLYVPRPGARSFPRLQCTQRHREPLETYVKGIEALTGSRPEIRQDKRGIYIAEVNDLEGIAKVLSAVGPFRAPQRIDQVGRFMKFLARERKGVGRKRVVERARKLLGL